ncbi:uncharacterized protein LOC120921812 [Rana temporaria]|uniref:uncharacterized protein LOC120921812 n=1 Tax=Rana temporaria TaxID=8407 RepID=UPI001AACE000|nr:uncharacterized protein LOC120921812 [Rana temporaria]
MASDNQTWRNTKLQEEIKENWKARKYTKRRKFIISGLLFPLMTFFFIKTYLTFSSSAEDNKTETLHKRDLQLSRNKRHFPRYSDFDTSNDIYGYACIGYGVTCCMSFYFFHSNTIEIHARIESKTKFTKMQGSYVHSNTTGTYECNLTDMGFWVIVIKGNETTAWTGDVTNAKVHTPSVGGSKTDIWFQTQYYLQFVDPEHLQITGDEKGDVTRVWDFQMTRSLALVKVKVMITVVDLIIPDIKVSPQSLKIEEGKDNLTLMCTTQIELPQNSLLTWKRNSELLGSLFYSSASIIRKGNFGNLDWKNNSLIFHHTNPNLNDSGIYECCLSLENYPMKCDIANVAVLSPEKTKCTNGKFIPASPFQINHFQSRHLLREGRFVIILWKFNISEWKISSRYPQCQEYLVNMELGIDKWFGTNSKNNSRNKRGIAEGILGGIGIVGSITNSMDITTLKSDLETSGLVGSKSIKVQRNLNQILENMVMKTATVIGPSIIHLQNITLDLMKSEQHSHIARTCLEIQTEYSTNFKITAQAFQSGITPLGVLQSLPNEYVFAKNHTDLWVNKWVGCNQHECFSTSMIPIAGREQMLVPITVLGLPVSDTQLLYYQLQYTDFALDSNFSEPEQLDLSSCLHFQSKIICLPKQDKGIFHSCFHNHSLCTARIEKVKTAFDLVTSVGKKKVCFQVMTSTETVKAFFLSCTQTEILKRGLYCIDGDLAGISINGIRVNLTNILMRDVGALPVQYNISQVDEFPWKEWADIIQKDKGLLIALSEELHKADIVFKHEQGKLKVIEHEWSALSSNSFWVNFKKTISVWGNTSVVTAAGNILLHPIVIIFIIMVLCILFQICIMIKMKQFYKLLKKEMKKGEEIMTSILTQRITSGLTDPMVNCGTSGATDSRCV